MSVLEPLRLLRIVDVRSVVAAAKKLPAERLLRREEPLQRDTSILPYGTQVVIGGTVYTVEDCGSGVNGNHIDIFFATHAKAVAFGRKSMKVYKY